MQRKKSQAEQIQERTAVLFTGMTPKEPEQIPGQMDMTDFPETAPDNPKAEPVTDQESGAKAKRTAKEKEKPAATDQEPEQEPQTKPGKESPVSIWLSADTKKRLKAMSRATGKSVSSFVSAAVQAHLDGYQLSEDERLIYDIVMRQSDE